MIDSFIIQAGYPLYSVIINNKITIYDILAVQFLATLIEHDEVFEKFKKEFNNYIVQSAIL